MNLFRGISPSLARFGSHLVGLDLWRQEASRSGVEMCFTIAAITGGYRMEQSFLGPKGHAEQAADLVPAMRQTVGWLFWSLDQYFNAWSATTRNTGGCVR